MTTVRLDLAYHGACFAGWAAQPGERTFQGELEAALGQVLGGPPSLTVAGRTDAGRGHGIRCRCLCLYHGYRRSVRQVSPLRMNTSRSCSRNRPSLQNSMRSGTTR